MILKITLLSHGLIVEVASLRWSEAKVTLRWSEAKVTPWAWFQLVTKFTPWVWIIKLHYGWEPVYLNHGLTTEWCTKIQLDIKINIDRCTRKQKLKFQMNTHLGRVCVENEAKFMPWAVMANQKLHHGWASLPKSWQRRKVHSVHRFILLTRHLDIKISNVRWWILFYVPLLVYRLPFFCVVNNCFQMNSSSLLKCMGVKQHPPRKTNDDNKKG